MQPIMFDTSAFNGVLDQKVSTTFVGHVIVTGVQASELRATRSTDRRTALLDVFEEIKPTKLFTSSFAFDIEGAGFDEARFNDGTGRFEKMLDRLQQLDEKKKDTRNQIRDILIAETALRTAQSLLVTTQTCAK